MSKVTIAIIIDPIDGHYGEQMTRELYDLRERGFSVSFGKRIAIRGNLMYVLVPKLAWQKVMRGYQFYDIINGTPEMYSRLKVID